MALEPPEVVPELGDGGEDGGDRPEVAGTHIVREIGVSQSKRGRDGLVVLQLGQGVVDPREQHLAGVVLMDPLRGGELKLLALLVIRIK